MILNLVRIQRNVYRCVFHIGNSIKRQIIGNQMFTLYNGDIKCKYASIRLLVFLFSVDFLWIRDIKLIQKHTYSANLSTLCDSMLCIESL
jgi:hypothetical protein